jgi:hypothetical protein
VIRQDRRIIPDSMVGRPPADMGLGEKFAYASTVRWLEADERADWCGSLMGFDR